MSNSMVVTRSSRIPRNGNLPVLQITPTELEIFRLNPTMWVDAQSGVKVDAGRVQSVSDRTGSKVWLPKNAQYKPTLLRTSLNVPYFQFGKIGVMNGGILESTSPVFPMDGKYILAVLANIPERNTGGWAGTGGNLIGNNGSLGNEDIYRMRLGNDDYTGTNVFLNHGGPNITGTDNYPINSAYAFRGAWHIHIITVDASMHRWEIDGAVLSQRPFPAKAFVTLEAQQMLIGGAGAVPAHGLQGYIAASVLVPGEVSTSGKAAIYRYMEQRKAALEAI